MRKWIVLLLLLLLAVSGFVYFTTPKNVLLHAQTSMAINRKAFARVFFETENWQQWWPKEGEALSPLQFRYNGARVPHFRKALFLAFVFHYQRQ